MRLRDARTRRHAGRRARRARQDRALDALLALHVPAPRPRTRLARVWPVMLPLLVLACVGGGFASTWDAAAPAAPAIEALALL